MSAVSATEVNETNQVLSTSNADTLSVGVNEVVNETYDSNLLSAGIDSGSEDILGDGETGSFADLNNLIKISTESLTLTSNYKYQGSSDDIGINITKSIIIDCNGYTIDGNNVGRGFTVTADNVVLKNVNIYNVVSDSYAGAVYWAGDNGQLINVKINNASDTVDGYAYSGGIS